MRHKRKRLYSNGEALIRRTDFFIINEGEFLAETRNEKSKSDRGNLLGKKHRGKWFELCRRLTFLCWKGT